MSVTLGHTAEAAGWWGQGHSRFFTQMADELEDLRERVEYTRPMCAIPSSLDGDDVAGTIELVRIIVSRLPTDNAQYVEKLDAAKPHFTALVRRATREVENLERACGYR
ncbi:hypothetical protein [Acuticoccus sediminis]|uniref:hypothetical protein n=1 Tax=Acuticoccus sediminis TaxID=2184697 RepID=UPI001CFF0260|nr:hypothetical protein [Acuticoccus sediminis]